MEDKIDSKIPALRTPVRELFGHTGAVSGAEWIAGGEQIITASWDRLAILHDMETGTVLVQLAGKFQEYLLYNKQNFQLSISLHKLVVEHYFSIFF